MKDFYVFIRKDGSNTVRTVRTCYLDKFADAINGDKYQKPMNCIGTATEAQVLREGGLNIAEIINSN